MPVVQCKYLLGIILYRNHLIQVRELVRDNNYDILALSESWLHSTVTNAEVEIKGFKLTRLDRLGKTGGGVCVYSKSSIKVKGDWQ